MRYQPFLLSAEGFRRNRPGASVEAHAAASQVMLRPLGPPGASGSALAMTRLQWPRPTIHWPFRRHDDQAHFLFRHRGASLALNAWSAHGPRGPGLDGRAPLCRLAQDAGVGFVSSAGLTSSPWSDDAPPTSLGSSLRCSPCCSGAPTFGSCGSAEFRGVPVAGSPEPLRSGLSSIGVGEGSLVLLVLAMVASGVLVVIDTELRSPAAGLLEVVLVIDEVMLTRSGDRVTGPGLVERICRTSGRASIVSSARIAARTREWCSLVSWMAK
jgi:hypothetical protein